jgi:hypothetical protein
MKNFEDRKEDLLQEIEDLSKLVTGTEKQALFLEIISDASLWGSQNNVERMGLLEMVKMKLMDGCEKDLKQVTLN